MIETQHGAQRTTVSARTMVSASTMQGTRRYSPKSNNRSKVPKTNLFGDFRRSTFTWCRRTSISAWSRTLERNRLVSPDHSSMRTLTIGHEHHPIRPRSPTVLGFRQGQESRAQMPPSQSRDGYPNSAGPGWPKPPHRASWALPPHSRRFRFGRKAAIRYPSRDVWDVPAC
jgi:hypothetical protein